MWNFVIASYGAVLGTIGTILGVKNYLKDRIRVKISIQRDQKTSPPIIPSSPDELFVVITAKNVGKYPVHLTKAWFELHKPEQGKKFILLAGPNNFHTEELKPGLNRAFVAKQTGLNLNNLKFACVEDAVGRKFKSNTPNEWKSK